MFKRILALLLLIPLLDAIVLVWLGFQFNPVLIVALVVLTALIGMLFVRAEGRRTMRKIQRALGEGRPPTDELLDGGLLIAAGAFLLTPGLVTDAVGFLLVLPPSRIVVRKLAKKFVVTPYLDKKTGGFASGKVYTFGFPGDDGAGQSGSQAGGQQGGQATDGAGDVYDLGSDAYDVEFDDDERDGRSTDQ
ncbi:FxsA family protein [Natronoarchaeum mannanilyticum]|uniref:Membrane protein FxsA n=1 Tax=Natronoarchaeum mannanilyticum TaxID=926360 RepID=A0AAV3T9G3_9EURY